MTPEKLILLVGTGPMAREYARVLREGLGRRFISASRSLQRAEAFAHECGADGAVALDNLNAEFAAKVDFAIVATAIESLADMVRCLVALGVNRLLVEKPGAISLAEAHDLNEVAAGPEVFLRIAYNRRYYASVQHLRGLLSTEKPLCAFFDFTEWSSVVSALPKPDLVKSRWAVSNSSHVFDTVAFLLGEIAQINSIATGKGQLPWHPSNSTFLGTAWCGETPVSWCSSWEAPGRWNIEVMTAKGRYKLSPMEKLQVLRPGSVTWADVELDYALDVAYKPGLYRMVEAFSQAAREGRGRCQLPTWQENANTLGAIWEIVGYEE